MTDKNDCNFCTTNLKQFLQNFDKIFKIKMEKEKISNSSDRNRTKCICINKFLILSINIWLKKVRKNVNASK
jgi:hypothetical protein